MNVIEVIKWLRVTPIPLTEISKSTGISRNTLHLWINGSTPREKNVEKIYKRYSNYINHEKFKIQNRQIKEDRMSLGSNESIIDGQEIDSRYIIKLQKTAIDTLTNEIAHLKNALDQARESQEDDWNDIKYDFIVKVQLHQQALKWGRTIVSVSNFDGQSKILGYSSKTLKDLWDVGKKYDKIGEHPIDTLLCKDTLKDVNKKINNLPILYDALKKAVGQHYIPQPLIYKKKDGGVAGAIAYNKVEWTTFTVRSKVKFITDYD